MSFLLEDNQFIEVPFLEVIEQHILENDKYWHADDYDYSYPIGFGCSI